MSSREVCARLLPELDCRIVTFGLSDEADVQAVDLVSLPEQGHQFRIRVFEEEIPVVLPVPGRFTINGEKMGSAFRARPTGF